MEKDARTGELKKRFESSPSLEKAALWVVKSMPKWTPGRHNGQIVKVRYNVPITFKLQ